MTEPTLAQRLLDGDRRALARAITLVEDDRPEGWELVKEVGLKGDDPLDPAVGQGS